MTGAIQIGTLGVDTGPFNLYSDVNGFTAPFEMGVSRNELSKGYPTDKVPDTTAIIRVVSTGISKNFLDILTGVIQI